MKKNKNSKRKKHYMGSRSDYRQGGRVALQRGGPRGRGSLEKYIEEKVEAVPVPVNRKAVPTPTSQPVAETPVVPAQPTTPSAAQPTTPSAAQPIEMGRPVIPVQKLEEKGNLPKESIENPVSDNEPQPIEYSEEELGRQVDTVRMPGGGNVRIPRNPRGVYPVPDVEEDPKDQFERERGERVVRTGQTAEKIAKGEIPEGMLPKQELVKAERGDEYIDKAVEMGELTPIEAERIKNVTPEEVAQMEASQAERPEVLEAAKMQAAKVTESPELQAAEGEVREESLAKAAKVDRVTPIEGVDVDIPEGALTERIVGQISDGAKASAAINAGTSLARITRAKKQLTKAGLSEEQIQEIGNDPAALEDRLADFSETERGIIEGLPEEALVSTQINGLLEGMEDGNIPVWAGPAVSQVEQMLAARGLSASTVGRDSLFNSIIQAAMPIAQSNAQAIQSSVSQQKNIEAAEAEANAQRRQQTATQNAQNVFNMDMAQFSSDQQIALSNSKFLQTVGLTEANNDQQAAVQNALLMSQANLAEADFYQKSQIQNAQAFLQTDMANLNNQQQANVLKSQFQQQTLLSNQSAENAARQFNSASENQTQQFMASLNTQVNQFNTAQTNATAQFNTQQKNAAEARRVGLEADINKANAAIVNQTKQFNQQLDFQREQWNAANEQAVSNSNVNWRRKANLADTAAANAVNQQNVQNAFGLTSSAQSFLWQEMRDQASFDFQWADNTATRKNNAMIAAASSEGDAAKNWSSNYNNVSSVVDKIFGTGG